MLLSLYLLLHGWRHHRDWKLSKRYCLCPGLSPDQSYFCSGVTLFLLVLQTSRNYHTVKPEREDSLFFLCSDLLSGPLSYSHYLTVSQLAKYLWFADTSLGSMDHRKVSVRLDEFGWTYLSCCLVLTSGVNAQIAIASWWTKNQIYSSLGKLLWSAA